MDEMMKETDFKATGPGRSLCAGRLAGALRGRARETGTAHRNCRSGRAPSTT